MMIKSFIFACFLTLLTAIPCFNAYADSFSCAGGIVSTDDSSYDVLSKCGQPDFIESHQEEVGQRFDDTMRRVYITVEEWTYNLGPSQLIRIVILKNGKVAEIRTGSYGTIKK